MQRDHGEIGLTAFRISPSRWLRAITILAILVGAFSFSGTATRASAAPSSTKYETFFVVDTSKSMAGWQGSKDIFDEVKQAASEYVGALGSGETVVYVYPFSKGLSTSRPYTFKITSAADKKAAQKQIGALKANGDATWIYNALSDVIGDASAVRAATPADNHVQTVFLFTDGKNNGPRSLKQTLRDFALARGENPYLFLKYITLGTTADAGWKGVDGVEVQNTPSGEMPQLYSVRIKPPLLDFGSMKTAKESARVVEIQFDSRLEGQKIRLNLDATQAEAKGALVHLTPDTVALKGKKTSDGFSVMTTTLTLSVDNKSGLDEAATYAPKLTLTSSGLLVTFSPGQIDCVFTMAPRSTVTLEARDRATLGIDLGEIDPFRSEVAVTKSAEVAVAFNDRAGSSGAFVTVRVSQAAGPKAPLVSLVGSDGARVDQLKLTSGDPSFKVSALVGQAAKPGDYTYTVVLEPHAAEVEGPGLTAPGGQGERTFAVKFHVPEPPVPLGVSILRWTGWLLLLVIALAVAGFVGLVLMTGAGPGRLLRVLMHSASPRILDTSLELTKPYDINAEPLDITGRKIAEMGAGTGVFEQVPFRLTFRPLVSISSADESLEVSIAGGSEAVLSVDRAATGTPDFGTALEVFDGDEVRIEAPTGVYVINVRSFAYRA